MTKQFRAQRLVVQRFRAIDGYALDVDSLPGELISMQYDTTANAGWDSKVRPGVICRISPGEVGCILSHLAVWEDLLASDHDAAIVLEDDVDLATGFAKSAFALITGARRWDLLYLGYQNTRGAIPLDRHGLGRPSQLFGTFAYAISRRGANRLLSKLPVTGPLDVFLSANVGELVVRCAIPPLVNHKTRALADSDIVHTAHVFARRTG